ncbi:(2Fe-2S)-binding protein [Oscillospiraceae bacterium]|nr:(2Fe-2S)-binding protein [Oscillospiraceae bacterium]BDF73397.1 (2Fe-2S)-binding protein [Oscillospiraceae bacterium]
MSTNKTKHYQVELTVNGVPQTFLVTADELLVDTLREQGGYTSVKRGCDNGECGACTVIMNKKAVPSCMVLTVEADGAEITTVEGLAQADILHPIQQAFLDNGAIQCGFCTPGMVLTTKALLDENPHPTDEEIREALQNNICRCTGYVNILKAVKSLI